MLAIIGLGNPGPEYEETRHNIGFRVIDALAGADAIFEDRATLQFRGSRIAGKRALLVKPLTYMNRSGRAVAPLVDEFSIEQDDLLVLSDDINLPLGRIRFRRAGGDGGQKGLGSIIEALGSSEFPRLRLGIGTPLGEDNWADYVLRPFPEDEREIVDEMVERAVLCVRFWIAEGPERAMGVFNR